VDLIKNALKDAPIIAKALNDNFGNPLKDMVIRREESLERLIAMYKKNPAAVTVYRTYNALQRTIPLHTLIQLDQLQIYYASTEKETNIRAYVDNEIKNLQQVQAHTEKANSSSTATFTEIAKPTSTHAQQSTFKITADAKVTQLQLEEIQSGELKKFRIEGEHLNASDISNIAEAIMSPNCQLEDLSLIKVGLDTSNSINLYKALKVNTTIRMLDLKGNAIGGEETKSLGEVLSTNQSIEFLYLSNCGLTSLSIVNMSAVNAFSKSRIKFLDLSDNQIGYYGIKYLTMQLQQNPDFLEIVSFANNKFSSENEIIEPLKSFLQKTKVKNINLRGNFLSQKFTQDAWGKVLQSTTTLNSLNLSLNSLNLSDAVFLTSALLTQETIERLDLSDNDIYVSDTEEGSELFSTFIENLVKNNNLTSVNLKNCYFSDDALSKLVSVVERNPNIISFLIDIQNSESESTLNKRLSEALAKNKKHHAASSISKMFPLSLSKPTEKAGNSTCNSSASNSPRNYT
jgi:Ran GTPase-activating protein (RanGAP) involved in mRNA processing and transport